MATGGRRRSSPSALSVLHRRRRDRRRRAGQGHPGVRVDDGDDLAGASRRRLLVVHVIKVAGHPWVNVGVAGSRGERDGRRDLLDGLDLVLEGRRVGRSTGERGPVGRSGMD